MESPADAIITHDGNFGGMTGDVLVRINNCIADAVFTNRWATR